MNRRLITAALVLWSAPATAGYDLDPEILVEAGGSVIEVPGYSVPSLADWNDDGLPDLVVGEGGGGETGKVRVHLNGGVPGAPDFATGPFYAQTTAGDLQHDDSG